jgi:GNAT superfamily N-acetyltransferase
MRPGSSKQSGLVASHATADPSPQAQERPTQSVEIKAVSDRDRDVWLPLWRRYQRFYEVDIPEPATLTTWSRFLDPAEPVHAVLAVSGSDTLGFAHFLYHRSTWSAGDYCYLHDLFVADEARGRGVGRILIEHVYADAKRQGAARVYWTTHQSNHDAMLLYDRIAERSEFIQYRKLLT